MSHPYHYHDVIMRIPVTGTHGTDYKMGHRDARHAAAEIANEADTRIESQQQTIEELAGALRALYNEQYDAPLECRRTRWKEAKRQALEALARLEQKEKPDAEAQ